MLSSTQSTISLSRHSDSPACVCAFAVCVYIAHHHHPLSVRSRMDHFLGSMGGLLSAIIEQQNALKKGTIFTFLCDDHAYCAFRVGKHRGLFSYRYVSYCGGVTEIISYFGGNDLKCESCHIRRYFNADNYTNPFRTKKLRRIQYG